jgi:oligosaccharide repeat unit polymerase
MLKNPFFTYVFVFGGALLAYQLGWSGIYPHISESVMWFFCITFSVAGVGATILDPTLRSLRPHVTGTLPNAATWVLGIGFIADILYTGGIPLWMIATGQDYRYTEFGIPTLHVGIVTFGGVFAAIRFTDYLYSKNKWLLAQAFMPVAYDILIANRGAALMVLVSWLFVLVIKRGGVGIRMAIAGTAAMVMALFIFGVLGNVRSGDVIAEIGQPTEAFTESGIPMPYFWAYIYLTSPIANFVENTDHAGGLDPKVDELIASELLPDFISKRVLPEIGAEDRAEFDQVSPALNVSTIFTRSYVYAGWLGVTIMFAALASLILLYTVFMSETVFAVPAMALLNTLVVFCVFDNMIAFTGMSLQLVWLVVLAVGYAMVDAVMVYLGSYPRSE